MAKRTGQHLYQGETSLFAVGWVVIIDTIKASDLMSNHAIRQPLFAFEQDFIGNWRCIPLCVRRKLDLCGVKLKLNHWLELSQDQRPAAGGLAGWGRCS